MKPKSGAATPVREDDYDPYSLLETWLYTTFFEPHMSEEDLADWTRRFGGQVSKVLQARYKKQDPGVA